MSPAHTEVTRLVAASVRGGLGTAPKVGPFSLLLDDHTDNVWRNYAVPDEGATPSAADVAALVATFVDRSRTPRLEYVPADAPAVEAALVTAGFTVEGRPPLMACRPGGIAAQPAVDGITASPVTGDADLLELAGVQNVAYGETEPATEHDVRRLRRLIDKGGVVVAARDAATGAIVGGGICTGPVEGVSELAAVAVASPYRRRGIAGTVVAALTAAAHDGGARLVWLEPAGEREAAIYARAGFAPDGEKLWISLPAGGTDATRHGTTG